MRRTVQRDAHAYEKKPCYHIENLANLDKLPKDLVFTFIRAPLLMKDSSASPIRAFALVPRAWL